VGVCLDATRRLGLDVLVLDQSRPDIDLSVTRVVVPGFRHFWRRLGPGRLYDVPVRLGWVPAPTAEADLNPTSIFF
jgi:ribosomal protein S12 methylthiotransferase accessory factor